MQTIGRFAPSPSGRMHLGNVLCALLAWLSARHQGGQYLLRIEDLDTLRCPRSYAELILDDLRWLGLDWDGAVPYQSERTAIYEGYEAILREKGLLYPCFCSRVALHAASAPHLSDGVFAYQLAVVVDDALSGVTEVVRGADLISSTPRQIWLHRLFGFEPPAFVHIPLLCDHDGRRLSKRDEDLDLGLLRQRFTPEQVIGALACAAGLTDRPEPVAARELAADFAWDKIPRHDLFLPDVFREGR